MALEVQAVATEALVAHHALQEVDPLQAEAEAVEVGNKPKLFKKKVNLKNMKRHLTFITILVCAVTTAQNIDEVLRYSTENLQGTARFQSMGGAFGALGGDPSALNINPAGSAIFNNSQFTFSGTSYNPKNTSRYFDGVRKTSEYHINLNQIGGALVFNSTADNSGWNKFALAFNYDIVQNFDDIFEVNGNSNQGIDNYFLDFAQGVPFGSIQLQDNELIENGYLDIGANQGFADQQAFLGYYGGVIDPENTDDDTSIYNQNANYTTVDQNLLRSTSGYNSKVTLNIASQYQEKLSLGASFNFHTVLYNRLDEFTETGYDTDSPIQRTTFDNLLHTEGSGFSFNLGAIAKLNDLIRVGASYQSPTWYRLEDDLAQRISSNLADDNIRFINFDQVNLFEVYKLKTPSKLTGSLALIFGKDGLLSFDYGYQDMSQAELRPTSDANFAQVNTNVANQLGAVNSLRLGGEYRIKRFSLRGGYRFEGSPYKDGNTVGDLNGLSAGIGYNFGGSRLDFVISRTERDIAHRLFDTGLTTPFVVNGINTNATLSYTINF
ncbi:putative hemin receptor [hydrothermal vent metagenome]|uniref:Putative hemin receptor n=1 Tax=hydrothermal vent metagenome TaxID=652676 RepID=A0A3B0TI21_9ZZZZ